MLAVHFRELKVLHLNAFPGDIRSAVKAARFTCGQCSVTVTECGSLSLSPATTVASNMRLDGKAKFAQRP